VNWLKNAFSAIGLVWVLVLFLAIQISLEFLPVELVVFLGVLVAIAFVIVKVATWAHGTSEEGGVTRKISVEYPSLFVSRSSGRPRELSLDNLEEAFIVESDSGHCGLGLSFKSGERLVHHLPVTRKDLQQAIEAINRACKEQA